VSGTAIDRAAGLLGDLREAGVAGQVSRGRESGDVTDLGEDPCSGPCPDSRGAEQDRRLRVAHEGRLELGSEALACDGKTGAHPRWTRHSEAKQVAFAGRAHRRESRIALQQCPDCGMLEPRTEHALDRWGGLHQHVA
jgi:hypothetical protein